MSLITYNLGRNWLGYLGDVGALLFLELNDSTSMTCVKIIIDYQEINRSQIPWNLTPTRNIDLTDADVRRPRSWDSMGNCCVCLVTLEHICCVQARAQPRSNARTNTSHCLDGYLNLSSSCSRTLFRIAHYHRLMYGLAPFLIVDVADSHNLFASDNLCLIHNHQVSSSAVVRRTSASSLSSLLLRPSSSAEIWSPSSQMTQCTCC